MTMRAFGTYSLDVYASCTIAEAARAAVTRVEGQFVMRCGRAMTPEERANTVKDILRSTSADWVLRLPVAEPTINEWLVHALNSRRTNPGYN